MKLRTKLSWHEVRNHLRYQGWLYLLFCVLAFGLTSLVYTQTAYRPPQDRRIDLYIRSSSAELEQVNAFLEPVWRQAVPEMELVNAVLLMSAGGANDYYADMQLVTYIAAAEGDIYMLPSSEFKRFASQGAFVALDDAIRDGRVDVSNLSLAAGLVKLVGLIRTARPPWSGRPANTASRQRNCTISRPSCSLTTATWCWLLLSTAATSRRP